MPQVNKIKIRRGLNANIPTPNTEVGELRYSTDSKELYIDDGSSNVKIGGDPAGFPISTATQTALDAKANASDTVNLTGDQTIAGVKTFSSSPIVPTATTTTQAINKAQMDAALALKVNKAGATMTARLNSNATNIGYAQLRGGVNLSFGTNGSGHFQVYNDSAGASIATMYNDGSGIEFGAGLWSIKYGTGFPEGVITAPVGSIYIDTAITNGASSWIKKSGTGNTGWEVLEGDTGRRNVTSLATGVTSGNIYYRRIQNQVTMVMADVVYGTSTGTVAYLNHPAGFAPDTGYSSAGMAWRSTARSLSANGTSLNVYNLANGEPITGSFTWATAQAYPSTLPGTA